MATTAPQIGRYELLTQLGEGGMARVYLAVSRGPVGFNKLVVVKQIRPELASDEEFLGMFSEEARIALCLHHPNIVQTYEIFEEEGQHLMAMEYLDGQSLADLLRRVGRDRMPLEEHLWILTQVLHALHHAHEMRDQAGLPMAIVHRDVSPSNVFITYNGEVKLVDFGIAKATGAISTTARGTVKAKLGYGAPEQFLGNPIDSRADIFSVGVMMWEALAGCRRKIGETRNAMIEARVTGQEPSIRAIKPEVPPALAAVCDRATALDPERRHGSAAELAYDIERVLQTRSRTVGPRQVAALVGDAFHDERMAMRGRIEQALGGSDADPTRDLAPRAASALLAPGAAPTAPVNEPISHSQLYSMDLPTAPGTPWSRRRKLAVGGGAAAAAALGAVLLFGGGEETPSARIGSEAGKTPAAVDVDRAPGPRPPGPGTVDTTMTGAAVSPAPFEQEGTATGGTGASLAKLERREPARKAPRARRAEAPAPTTPVAVAEEAPAARPAIIPPPLGAPERPAAREVPARRAGAQPGDDLSRTVRGRPAARRALDEQDPYK